MFWNWKEYESKHDHYDLGNTSQVSQQIKDIIDLSSQLVLLTMQLYWASEEQQAIFYITNEFPLNHLTNSKVFIFHRELPNVEVLIFGIDDI